MATILVSHPDWKELNNVREQSARIYVSIYAALEYLTRGAFWKVSVCPAYTSMVTLPHQISPRIMEALTMKWGSGYLAWQGGHNQGHFADNPNDAPEAGRQLPGRPSLL